MTQTPNKVQRPLSPYMYYKPQITSVLSIFHRLSGVALVGASIPLVLWLWGAAYDHSLFECVQGFLGHWVGQIMLFCWTMAFYFHLANGIRHLFWDVGRGFDLKSVEMSGIFVLVFVICATSGTWIYIYNGA